MKSIKEMVRSRYWELEINCARTMLECLGTIFHMEIPSAVTIASVGLHGAGGFGGQCGLVEGALLFTGLYANEVGLSEEDATALCYAFAEAFAGQFGSLQCRDLRPNGFREDDPPHACEQLTVSAVEFASAFLATRFPGVGKKDVPN